MLSFEVDLT